MAGRSQTIFVSVAGGWVGALAAGPSRGGARVSGWLIERVPADIDAADERTLGDWLGGVLSEAFAGGSRVGGPAVLCLERKEVAAKRLGFDSVADREADLPGMVRLAMLRQLTFPSDEAAIDYVETPVRADDGPDAAAVRAVAAPGPRLAHLKAVLERSGVKPSRAGLTAEGLTHLLGERGVLTGDEPALVVCPTLGGVELIIVRGGVVATARWHAMSWAEVERGNAGFGEGLVAEAKRTWMSDQLAADAERVARVLVVSPGDEPVDVQAAHALAEEMASDLGIVGSTVENAAVWGASLSDGDGETPPARLLPLLGVAFETFDGKARGQRFDLLHPRRAPDRAAPVRKAVLLSAMLLLLVIGGMWTAGNRAVARLDAQAAERREALGSIASQRARAIRQASRVEHIRRHLAGGFSPLERLDTFTGEMPERGRALLTGLGFSADSFVEYDSGRGRWYEDEHWSSGRVVLADVGIKATSRAVADGIRAMLVGREDLIVETSGVDGATTSDARYPVRLELKVTQAVSGVRLDADGAQPMTPAEPSEPRETETASADGGVGP
jgi:hypothetical protein